MIAGAGHPVWMVEPAAFKAARPRWGSAGAKSDLGDAFTLADYARTDGHRLRRIEPVERATRELAALVRARTALVHSDAVVSHAGSGTFLGALAHGLPQLCLPQAADQFRNAHAGVESGAALKLHPEHATPEAIADAVSTLLADNTFHTNANRIRTEINTMPAPDKVTKILQTPLDSGHTPTP